jgi:lauroyl/myristoyl acyltransferase
LPVYLIRSYGGDLRLTIEPEITLARTGNLSADISQNTSRIASHLEELISRYPDQWNWLTVRMRGTYHSSLESRESVLIKRGPAPLPNSSLNTAP